MPGMGGGGGSRGGGGFSGGGGSRGGGGFSGGGGSRGGGAPRPPASGPSRPPASGSPGHRPFAPPRPHNPHPVRPPQGFHRPHSGLGGFIGGMIVGGILNGINKVNNGGGTYNNYYGDGTQDGQYYNSAPAAPLTGTCSYCGTTYRQEDVKCPSCGASVPPLGAAEAGAGTYSPDQSGTGAYYTSADGASGKHVKAKKKRKIFQIVAVVVIVMIMAAVISNVFGNRTYTEEIGGTHATKVFDFAVTAAEIKTSYDQGQTVYSNPGYYAVIVDLRIKNTCGEDLYFYINDFWLVGKDYYNNDYELAPESDGTHEKYFNTLTKKMFRFDTPYNGEMTFFSEADKTINGRLVYIIPDSVKNAKLDYTEYEYGKKGDRFLVNIF